MLTQKQGGAAVVDACNTIQAEVSDVLGLVVLDIVEGNFMLDFPIHHLDFWQALQWKHYQR